MVRNLKLKLAAGAAFLCAFGLFAYNPPAGGENLPGIAGPVIFNTASSTVGGAFYDVAPSSIAFNPALPAFEQRNVLDAGFTMIHCSEDPEDKSLGGAFETGIMVPTKWGVGTAELFGAYVPFYEMQLGKVVGLKYAASRDVTDNLAVGAGFTAGYLWGYSTDFIAAADLGFVYNMGDFAFFKDFRFGASLMNLGKTFTSTEVWGIKGKEADVYPGIATVRAGAAGTFFEKDDFAAAVSADISVPMAQNFILDTGLQFKFKDFVTFSTSWQYNAQEVAEDCKCWMPSVGLTFKFLLNSKDNAFMKENGWQQSEVAVSGAYKKMYEHINAVSGGVKLNLGMKDTQAPKIKLFDEK